MNLLKKLALLLMFASPAAALGPISPYESTVVSTATGKATHNLSGRFYVAKSSVTASTPTVTVDATYGIAITTSGVPYGGTVPSVRLYITSNVVIFDGASGHVPCVIYSSGTMVCNNIAASGGVVGPVDWANLFNFPTGCTLPNVVTAVGGTITCSQPSNVTGNAATATTASNITGGGAGQIVYQSASGVTTFLPAMGANGLITGSNSSSPPSTGTITGTANQVVVTQTGSNYVLSTPQNINSGAAPTFVGTNFSGTAASLTAGAATNIAGGGAGQFPYNTASGATSFLPQAAASASTPGMLFGNGASGPSTGTIVAGTNITLSYANSALTITNSAAAASTIFQSSQVFKATGTWTSGTGTQLAYVVCEGGTGAGGPGYGQNDNTGGGGSGAGGVAAAFVSVATNTAYAVAVGFPGVIGTVATPGTDGTAGGQSTFGVAMVVATGGLPGTHGSASSGGNGSAGGPSGGGGQGYNGAAGRKAGDGGSCSAGGSPGGGNDGTGGGFTFPTTIGKCGTAGLGGTSGSTNKGSGGGGGAGLQMLAFTTGNGGAGGTGDGTAATVGAPGAGSGGGSSNTNGAAGSTGWCVVYF